MMSEFKIVIIENIFQAVELADLDSEVFLYMRAQALQSLFVSFDHS